MPSNSYHNSVSVVGRIVGILMVYVFNGANAVFYGDEKNNRLTGPRFHGLAARTTAISFVPIPHSYSKANLFSHLHFLLIALQPGQFTTPGLVENRCCESCHLAFVRQHLIAVCAWVVSICEREGVDHLYKHLVDITKPLHIENREGRLPNWETQDSSSRTFAFSGRLRIVNNLPNSIRSVPMMKAFKTLLKTTLTKHAFYSIDEFMAHNKIGGPLNWLTDRGIVG
ncbi:hypothetical protein J6590_018350 [Homalodisca vitripennis]|nr:hypothetical protein J6590_018350 [Homalodisca vitripennis]